MLATCQKCKQKLFIRENSLPEGSYESEPVFCPSCDSYVIEVITNGFPTAHVLNDNVINLFD